MLDYPVITPENVRFHYSLAGPGTRFLAWVIDMVLVTALILVLTMVYQFLRLAIGGYADAIFGIALFLLLSGYWILLEFAWRGTTVGKRVLRLRVIGERGLRLTFGQIVLRNLLRFIDLLPGPGGVAALFMLLHPQHRRLGDLVAGTLVIRERKVPPPDRIRGLAGPGPGSRAVVRRFPASVLGRIPREEREFLVDLCLRRDRLSDEVRHELFARVAESLREDSGVEVEEGLSDEKLVLLVTAELLDLGSR